MELLDREVARARRYARPLSLILGRAVEGATITPEILGKTWMALARDVDFGAQLDETRWVMALPETGRAGAVVAAERFRRGMESLTELAGVEGSPVILGVVTHPYHGTSSTALLENADHLSGQTGSPVSVAEFPTKRQQT